MEEQKRKRGRPPKSDRSKIASSRSVTLSEDIWGKLEQEAEETAQAAIARIVRDYLQGGKVEDVISSTTKSFLEDKEATRLVALLCKSLDWIVENVSEGAKEAKADEDLLKRVIKALRPSDMKEDTPMKLLKQIREARKRQGKT